MKRSQLELLDALISAAAAAREAARKDRLFASTDGIAFLLAAYSLTEVDGLWEFAKEVARETGLSEEATRSRLYAGLIGGGHLEAAE